MSRFLLHIAALLLLVGVSGYCNAGNSERTEAALKRLDAALDSRSHYIDARQQRIDSLCGIQTAGEPASPEILMQIADAYSAFNNDSALAYLRKGVEATEGAASLPFRWKYASLLPLGGFFDGAQREYEAIDADSVPDSLKASYYEAGRQMHSYIASFFKMYPDVQQPHARQALELQEKLLELLPDSSAEYKYQLGEYYLLTGRRQMARVLLEEIVDREPQNSNIRARAAHHLSAVASDEGDADAYKYYLAVSAIADVMSATREVISLQELGAAVYSSGDDVARAHKYISNALANAVECGAPLRMVDASKSLPIIERSHSESIAGWRRRVLLAIAVMALLVVGLIASMFVLRREMNKMKQLQTNLKTANAVKEVYISRFMQLCSIYMDKLNSFSKMAARKLAAGQSDELYRMVKSGKFVEEQSREFYEVFDNAFLHIYPDFVEQVNALLRPEERIELRPGEHLNTDLRILAFMRLGIEESTRIAQVLNYSLNTIYAYRNRIKARAIDKDNFEQNIMKIASVY